MRFLAFRHNGQDGLAIGQGETYVGLKSGEAGYPGQLDELLAKGPEALAAAAKALAGGSAIDLAAIEYLVPVRKAGKVICLGLNYKDHAAEGGFEPPSYPTIFGRFASNLIPNGAPIVRPKVSEQLDYEGEMIAVIGKGGRHISKADALSHVAGYSIFNDGSVRDYQMRTPQWTVGKNFDNTGAFGPVFVTADELPPGAAGLKLETRLNGQVLQSASTSDMIFDVATTIVLLSECFALEAGDILVMGTPAGIGLARKPPIFMKAGDVCEISIEGIGVLRNPIVDEA